MSKKLEILKGSLEKKQAVLDAKYSAHFADVAQANGQPLNDKRNGASTLNRWEKQSNSIRTAQKELEKTKNAIEDEVANITVCTRILSELPECMRLLVNNGTLNQWKKNPSIFFVNGVDKARIQFKRGKLTHNYVAAITDKEQYAKFANIFNELKRQIAH